jgi:UDP-N-acetylglucosamine:LPS N-acetylglucosamine transferase
MSAAEADRYRILFCCSGGGHLSQLLVLRSWWERHDRLWVSFPTAQVRSALAGEQLVECFHPTTRNVRNLVRNTALAWRLLRKERPDVVFTTGAAVAVPFVVLARCFGIRSVYLEVYDRVDSTTVSGRLCHRVVDRFLVQWPSQQALYPGSVLVGPVW